MALDRKITAPFAGATNSGTPVDTVSLPLAVLPGLTVENATIATSDYPSFVLAFLTKLVTHYSGLASADRPKAIVPKLETSAASASGDFPTSVRYRFTVDIYVPVPSPVGAEAEPVA